MQTDRQTDTPTATQARTLPLLSVLTRAASIPTHTQMGRTVCANSVHASPGLRSSVRGPHPGKVGVPPSHTAQSLGVTDTCGFHTSLRLRSRALPHVQTLPAGTLPRGLTGDPFSPTKHCPPSARPEDGCHSQKPFTPLPAMSN